MDSKEDNSTKCKFFVKKSQTNRRFRQNIRRDSSSASDEDNGSAVVVNTDRKSVANPLIQSTNSFKNIKKRKFVSNETNEENDSNDESFRVSYKSKKSGEREGPEDMGATSTVQTETDKALDAQTIFERSLEVNKELKGKEDDHIYRGINNYTQYVTKKDTPQGNASSGYVRKGPVRAPENIRSTVRWDYQPDLCKDYKETGYCGFGDSCIFLHDRSDYKSGWQLEMETLNKDKANDEDLNKYVIQEDNDLPFKCLICRQSFDTPVVTKCKHYFCEKCALNHFKKSSRCYVCGNQTMGVFNTAKEIIKRLKVENPCDATTDDNNEEISNYQIDDQSNDSDSE